jgi:hypothetical protein
MQSTHSIVSVVSRLDHLAVLTATIRSLDGRKSVDVGAVSAPDEREFLLASLEALATHLPVEGALDELHRRCGALELENGFANLSRQVLLLRRVPHTLEGTELTVSAESLWHALLCTVWELRAALYEFVAENESPTKDELAEQIERHAQSHLNTLTHLLKF